MGRTELVVQPATNQGSIDPVAGFILWESEQRKGGDEAEVATAKSQGKGPDACFAAKQTYKAPSPRKLTFYLARA